MASLEVRLCLRGEDFSGVLSSFETARGLAGNGAEQRHLDRRVQHVPRRLD